MKRSSFPSRRNIWSTSTFLVSASTCVCPSACLKSTHPSPKKSAALWTMPPTTREAEDTPHAFRYHHHFSRFFHWYLWPWRSQACSREGTDPDRDPRSAQLHP